jgi:hypothetical protein
MPHHLIALALQRVAVAPEDQDLGMMHEAVDHGRHRDRISEDLSPSGEGLVRADNER